MDLEFIDQRARDLFIDRFHTFLQLFIKSAEHAVRGDTNSSSIEQHTDSNEDSREKFGDDDDDDDNDDASNDDDYYYNVYGGLGELRPIDFDDRALSNYNPLSRSGRQQQQKLKQQQQQQVKDNMLHDHRSFARSDSKQRTKESPTLHMHELYSKQTEEDDEYKLTMDMKFNSRR